MSLLLAVVLVLAVIVLVIFVVVPELSSTVKSLAVQIEAAIPRGPGMAGGHFPEQ